MKNEVSSLELRALVQELQQIVGSRIDKIYQPEAKTFLLQLRKVGEEKRLLRIELPKYFYLTSKKEEVPDKLTGFCGYLRKYIEGMPIVGLEQIGSERVVKVSLASKEEKFTVYLEFFGKGNVVVCDAEGTVLNCLETVLFKERMVKPGIAYDLPERSNVFTLSSDKFYAGLEGENISTALATIGIGRLLAHELCARAGVAPGVKVTAAAAEKLYVAWQNLLKQKITPMLAGDEVILFQMQTFEKANPTTLHSLSEGLDKLFAPPIPEKKVTGNDKMKTVIAMQEQNAVRLEKDAEEVQKKGEFIYENYQEIKKLLDEIVVEMKHHSLQELQEKYKNHKHIKEIDPATGMITLDF